MQSPSSNLKALYFSALYVFKNIYIILLDIVNQCICTPYD